MRAVVQRVSRAAVRVNGEVVSTIGPGLVVLVGVASADVPADATWLAGKVRTLRIFADDAGAMNRSVEDTGGSIMVVSQFTLLADARRGRRPSFVGAAAPEAASSLCDAVATALRDAGLTVAEGRFRAHMQVELVNDGPVTILLDSAKRF